MIYPGYVPREGIDPILLHYGLPFSVGNWSFNKLAHHDDGIVYECNKLFPEPPYPKEVHKPLYLYKETCGCRKTRIFQPHGVLLFWEKTFLCLRMCICDALMMLHHFLISKDILLLHAFIVLSILILCFCSTMLNL